MKKKILEWILSIVLIIVIALAATVIAAPHFGWQFGKVASSSMEPTLQVGSVVIAKSVDLNTLKIGDIITYNKTKDHTVVHRIVGIVPEGFQTQGDANEEADLLTVPPQAVTGKVEYHIPYLGYAADFAKSHWGFIFLLLIPALLLIAKELRSIWLTTRQKGIDMSPKEGPYLSTPTPDPTPDPRRVLHLEIPPEETAKRWDFLRRPKKDKPKAPASITTNRRSLKDLTPTLDKPRSSRAKMKPKRAPRETPFEKAHHAFSRDFRVPEP